MREERKLEKAIRRDGEQTQSEILSELQRRYPQYTEQSETKQAAPNRRRIAVFSALAAVAACLAIILPCSILLPNRKPSDGGGSNIFYCSITEYEKTESEYNIGQYNQQYGSSILYFDWYSIVEDCTTEKFVRIDNHDVLGFQEYAYNPETDEIITFSVTKDNVYLEEFDIDIQDCKNEQAVTNHLVKWNIGMSYSICIFEHTGYRYFIKIEAGRDENRLFELVEELLQGK